MFDASFTASTMGFLTSCCHSERSEESPHLSYRIQVTTFRYSLINLKTFASVTNSL
jgi:hypothetical protein